MWRISALFVLVTTCTGSPYRVSTHPTRYVGDVVRAVRGARVRVRVAGLYVHDVGGLYDALRDAASRGVAVEARWRLVDPYWWIGIAVSGKGGRVSWEQTVPDHARLLTLNRTGVIRCTPRAAWHAKFVMVDDAVWIGSIDFAVFRTHHRFVRSGRTYQWCNGWHGTAVHYRVTPKERAALLRWWDDPSSDVGVHSGRRYVREGAYPTAAADVIAAAERSVVVVAQAVGADWLSTALWRALTQHPSLDVVVSTNIDDKWAHGFISALTRFWLRRMPSSVEVRHRRVDPERRCAAGSIRAASSTTEGFEHTKCIVADAHRVLIGSSNIGGERLTELNVELWDAGVAAVITNATRGRDSVAVPRPLPW